VVAVAERIVIMSLVNKKTKEVFQIKGQDREYDNVHDALWHYTYTKIDELRRNDIDNYERDIAKLTKQIRIKQDICTDILGALKELKGLTPEDEEWDDDEPASNKFQNIGDEE
jgi:hypothetical protein